MRNTVSFFKQYCSPIRLSSALALSLVLAQPLGSRTAAAAEDPKVPGRPAPELARLFTPPHAPAGAYEVTVLPSRIEDARREVRAALAPGAPADPGDGTWQVKRMNPLELFGDAGVYNKTTLARLYGGLPPSVVRGPIERDGRTVAAATLVSPYPDASLSRLEPGTMVILLHLQPGTSRPASSPARPGSRAIMGLSAHYHVDAVAESRRAGQAP